MTNGTKDLLVELTKDRELPEGCDTWGIRSVHPDFTSSRGYRWPYPGQTATAPGPFIEYNTGGCPRATGDGICLATNWAGMSSGGIPAVTLLLAAYALADQLGSEQQGGKVRVRSCQVVDLIDGARLLRDNGSQANLSGANLSGADLSSANLSGANLSGANLSSANLSSANLSSANLRYADLIGADLRYADLSGADLRYAYLSGANLSSANLSSADLRYANLSSADLRYADLSGATASNWTTTPLGYAVDNGRIVLS